MRTVVVGEVEQHSDHGPHAVLHRLTHVAVVAVGQRGSAQRHGAVVQRPAVALDHVLAVSQSSAQGGGGRQMRGREASGLCLLTRM